MVILSFDNGWSLCGLFFTETCDIEVVVVAFSVKMGVPQIQTSFCMEYPESLQIQEK